MKKFLSVALGLLAGTCAIAQNFNLTLRATLPYSGSVANIGGYVDTQGNEYALVGISTGLSIVDVTNPSSPVIKFTVNGPTSDWREVKTWGTYAYVTTEGGSSGLQIVDLSNLPASINSKYWKGNGAINNQLQTIHALHIDAGHAYLYGSNLFNGAAIIIDLTDPWNPTYEGHTPGTYIHDGYVRSNRLYGGHIYDGYFAVYDVTNKANPVLLAQQTTPGSFTHNTWLNDAGTVLLTTDEVNNSYLTSYDITDLGDIKELDRFQVTPGSGSIVHNTHVLNDFAVTSWYKDGVSITDVSRPGNIISVGRYDTYTQGSGGGFSGCWGVYPFLPSGTIVASDINNGLFVFTPTYVRGCYLEGIVTDSVSGLPLSNATVQVLTLNLTKVTNLSGEYKTGTVTPGSVTVQVSRPGYFTKTISNVVLANGQLTTLDVQLVPSTAMTASGLVRNAITGTGVAGAKVRIFNGQSTDLVTTDANGNFAIPAFSPDAYSVDAGKWTYTTYCADNVQINASTVPIIIDLQPGIYDDFTFDLGWTVSGTSSNAWEIGVPIATTNAGQTANPGADVTTDCRNKAYVTDNGGGGPWDNDVDGGNTVLTSPIFDATQFTNPTLKYYRWFHNSGNQGSGNPDDTLTVKLTNGITTVLVEAAYPNTPNNSSWVARTYNIASLIAPTANMRFIIETADWGPTFNIVEGGLDKFEVVEGPVGISENNPIELNAYPNPFQDVIRISYNASRVSENDRMVVTDIAGRVVAEMNISPAHDYVEFGRSLSAGVYSVQILNHEYASSPVRITKTR